MKKNLIPLVLLGVLLIIIAVIYIKRNSSTPEEKQKDFTVTEVKKVTKIILTKNPEGIVTTLENQDGIWMVNGKFPARKVPLNDLLVTMTRQRAERPVSDAATENTVKSFISNSVRVEVYKEGGDEPTNVFLVGAPTTTGIGTKMVTEWNGRISERTFVVNVPGFRGNLTPRYFVGEDEWRSREVFGYEPGTVQEVKIEYHLDPDRSFKLHHDGQNWNVDPLNQTVAINDTVHFSRIENYLSNYESLSVEAFDNEYYAKDSILTTQPFATISVTDVLGAVNEMIVYFKPVDKSTKKRLDAEGNLMPFDIDRYFVSVNNGSDFALIQTYVFGKVFKFYNDFYDFRPVEKNVIN